MHCLALIGYCSRRKAQKTIIFSLLLTANRDEVLSDISVKSPSKFVNSYAPHSKLPSFRNFWTAPFSNSLIYSSSHLGTVERRPVKYDSAVHIFGVFFKLGFQRGLIRQVFKADVDSLKVVILLFILCQ